MTYPYPHSLYALPVYSSFQLGSKSIDGSAALELDGVVAVLTAKDIPGVNDASAFAHDEPLLAAQRVEYIGQLRRLCVCVES